MFPHTYVRVCKFGRRSQKYMYIVCTIPIPSVFKLIIYMYIYEKYPDPIVVTVALF